MYLKNKNELFSPIVSKKAGNYEVQFNDGTLIPSIKKIDDNYFRINGIDFYKSEDKKNIYISTGDEYFVFNKVEDSDYDYSQANGNSNIQEVKSPMPGNVIKLSVSNGDLVSTGDPMIIIEAMKMETTIYASIDGVVSDLNLSQGEQIEADKILLRVSKLDNDK